MNVDFGRGLSLRLASSLPGTRVESNNPPSQEKGPASEAMKGNGAATFPILGADAGKSD